MANKIISISISNVDFECPYCKEQYNDIDEKYLNRCNKNKSYITKIKCKCSKSFGMTYDYKGNAQSFRL